MVAVSKKQYWAIKHSLTASEYKLIDFYDVQWHLRNTVPTVEVVALRLGLSQVTVNYYLQREPVIKALEKRGIPFRQHTQSELTATQVAVAVTMMNFADTRPNEVKLDQLGINATQYYAWMKDPQFKNLLDTLADQNIKNIKPAAIGELTKKINAGDWNAVKYYLDVTGALVDNTAPESEQLIKAFVEVIQKHIKDPNVMLAITQDLISAANNRTLEAVKPAEINGEIADHDPELENAKKVLGI